jgi:hypothetical protein
VLAAWDEVVNRPPALAAAMSGLRTALAKPSRASAASPRGPRSGTKQEQVLALLRRREGACGPQIAAATGWAAHTVRGFLAGLGKKGITVTALQRVRQVGPEGAGAKGAYTIYRVEERA